MNSAGKVSARHGHPRETLNLKRGGRRLRELEHKKRQTKKKKKRGQTATDRANTLERAYSLSLLQILLCSIKVNLGPKACKL